MTLDLKGSVVSFNEAAERITGYTFASLRDRSWQESPFAGCPPMTEFFADAAAPAGELDSGDQSATAGWSRDPRRVLVLSRCDRRTAPRRAWWPSSRTSRSASELRSSSGGRIVSQRSDNSPRTSRTRFGIPLAAISGAVEVLRDDFTLTGGNRQLLDLAPGRGASPEAHHRTILGLCEAAVALVPSLRGPTLGGRDAPASRTKRGTASEYDLDGDRGHPGCSRPRGRRPISSGCLEPLLERDSGHARRRCPHGQVELRLAAGGQSIGQFVKRSIGKERGGGLKAPIHHSTIC